MDYVNFAKKKGIMSVNLITISEQKVDIHYLNLIKRGWKLLKKYFAIMVVTWLVAMGIQMMISWSAGLVEESVLEVPMALVYIILSVVISAGWVGIHINIAQEKAVQVSDLFKQVKISGRYFLAQLVVGLIVFAGLLLFIVPGIYWSLKYTFVPYLVIGKKAGVREALRLSGQMTEGIKWKLLAFLMITMLFNLGGLMLFVVGVLITAPITYLAIAALYVALVERVEN